MLLSCVLMLGIKVKSVEQIMAPQLVHVLQLKPSLAADLFSICDMLWS